MADTALMFGGSMGVTCIWLFRRDWLAKKEARRILLILCIVLAFVGLLGCAILLSERPTRLHFLIFPLAVLLFHSVLLRYFEKRLQRAPIDTAFTAAGSLEDRIFNIVFAVVSLLVPVVLGSFMEKLAS